MADDPTATAVEPSSDIVSEESYINPDGSYKEGWKEALLPEELRAEKFYDSPFNTNVKELLKTAGNQAKMLGKKGIVPINDKSTEFEIQQYRQAMGIPEKYEYQKPEGLKMLEEQDEIVAKMLEKWNKSHVPPAHVNMFMEDFHNFIKNVEMQAEASEKAESAEQDRQILTEENTNYETNTLYIDNAVRQFTQGWPDEDVLALFPSKEHPNADFDGNKKLLMRKFLANVGKSIGEGRMVTGDVTGKSLQQQLDEVMKSPEYQVNTYGKAHTEAVNKALKLREQINAQQGRK